MGKMFFCEFWKIFKDIFSFDRTPQDDYFLFLFVNFEFSRTLPLQSTSGELLFRVPVDKFRPPGTVKNYFTGPFKCFCTITRRSHSKAFTHLKSLKTVKELICNEVNKRKLLLLFSNANYCTKWNINAVLGVRVPFRGSTQVELAKNHPVSKKNERTSPGF